MYWGTLFRAKMKAGAGLLLLAMALTVLTGCMAAGTLKPETADKESLSTEGKDPTAGPNMSCQETTVSRLADGREGFVITEIGRMDDGMRLTFARAVVLMNEQEYGRAIELMEEVIDQSPGVTAPYINIAIAYRQIDQPDKAEMHLKSALEIMPDHPVACNEYGLLCRKSGRFDEARALYEKAIEGFPDYYPVRRNLGILCDLYLNDLECALVQYGVYSTANPDDRQVKMWIADLRNRLAIE